MSPAALARVSGPVTRAASILEVFASRQGEGICIGDPQVFIRFGGCNLACDYCDTPESIPVRAGERMELPALLSRVDRLTKRRPATVSLTGGEPLLQVRFLEHLIPALRSRGHRIYLETNGSLPRALDDVIEGCDWIAMDIKVPSATRRHLWEAHRWFLDKGRHKAFVKIVLTAATTDAEIAQAITLIASVSSAIPLILQPATPCGGTASVPLPRLVSWWAQAAEHLRDVRVLPQIHPLWGIP